MRLLCVSRHAYLSEHLCRYFRELGAHCEPAVGLGAAVEVAKWFEPHLVVSESDLLGPVALETWSRDSGLRDTPVLAVSLSRRPDESMPVDMCGLAGVIYLPLVTRAQLMTMLESACRPLGVDAPSGTMGAPHLAQTSIR